ncbi:MULTISPECIES: thiamine pyrophosphate-binding protein [unclassified Brevundimonas]|uniref:thiamine pyrophosphate-binding protein n=1 Tax=unclassified Brevundimonas TaxID=2622653 RepID=UPI0025C4B640|nr:MULTISPECIES: thiamine pyrophosphate-binding protein [unclassified Brevundimonas]
MTATPVSSARRLVETLVVNGIDKVFCVPGESYLAVLDALYDVRDKIEVIVCRHEAGAANMAEAYGKLTGKPGICMVTRGPGATQASIGVHTAQQDSTPMILFVGQIALSDRGRGAFQEVDYRQTFGTLAKWATEIESPERTVEIVERAFATALQGRMGPVVIALPEDLLHEDGGPAPVKPVVPARSALDPAFVSELTERLSKAESPLLVLGGSGWSDEATTAIGNWAERLGIPLALSFRRKDLISNLHPCYAGDLGIGCSPKLIERVKQSDLIIAIGARLGENATQGYTTLDRTRTAKTLVHILPGAEETGRVWAPLMSATADNSLAGLAIANIAVDRLWHDQARAANEAYKAFSTPIETVGAVNLSEVARHLTVGLPKDAVLTNGAGNFAAWLHRFYHHQSRRAQVAPTSGAMGYGYPAALAAKAVMPERMVVCFAGDGDFMMSACEMATAVQYNLPVIVIVVDNSSFGTIRMHQETHYPSRVIATDIKNPDFVKYAEAFGAFGIRVTATGDFPDALAKACEVSRRGQPALIHLIADTEQISPAKTITELRSR